MAITAVLMCKAGSPGWFSAFALLSRDVHAPHDTVHAFLVTQYSHAFLEQKPSSPRHGGGRGRKKELVGANHYFAGLRFCWNSHV